MSDGGRAFFDCPAVHDRCVAGFGWTEVESGGADFVVRVALVYVCWCVFVLRAGTGFCANLVRRFGDPSRVSRCCCQVFVSRLRLCFSWHAYQEKQGILHDPVGSYTPVSLNNCLELGRVNRRAASPHRKAGNVFRRSTSYQNFVGRL